MSISIDTETGKAAEPELSTERVKRIFSKIAKRYERFNAVSSFGAYRGWLRKMVDAAPIDSESRVLDLAGGTGDVTFCMAKRKKPGSIMCTDLVPEMLEVAKMHYEQGEANGVDVKFDTVDAQNTPFEDGSFDCVTMAYGLRNMPRREQALSEVFRVLKPGGTFVCLDFSTPGNPAWRALYSFYLRRVIPFWGQMIAGDRDGFVYLARSIKAFPDQRGVAGMLEDAGFQDVAWQNCTGGIAAVHVASKPALADA